MARGPAPCPEGSPRAQASSSTDGRDDSFSSLSLSRQKNVPFLGSTIRRRKS
jgi:hypothetical protein